MADVERDDARGAALQQHVGEAAGRCADVERLVDRPTSMLKDVERVGELKPAAADVRMVGRDERDVGLQSIRAPAFDTGCPLTRTCAARISARARSRLAARPRSTTS